MKYAWYVCLCGGDVNAKVIHVPETSGLRHMSNLREKKSRDSDFQDFPLDVDSGDFGVEGD